VGYPHRVSKNALGGNGTGRRMKDTLRIYERLVNKEECPEEKTRKSEKDMSKYLEKRKGIKLMLKERESSLQY
jgi:hypothetical protein